MGSWDFVDFAEVLHLLHVTVLPLVPWKPPSLTAESPTKKSRWGPKCSWRLSANGLGDLKEGQCSGDAVLLPSFGAMQKSDKGGSPTDLRIKRWEKSRGFTSVLSFCGNQGRWWLGVTLYLGILYSCWQQEKCMGASWQFPCISSFGTLAAHPGPDGPNGKAERHWC